jgi:hypothetical protein
LLFGLIPNYYKNTLGGYIVFDKNIKTENGLNPNSTVKQLMAKYPDITVGYDHMTDAEYIYDSQNNCVFEFRTGEKNQIGKYKTLDGSSDDFDPSSKPIRRMNMKAVYISKFEFMEPDSLFLDSLQNTPKFENVQKKLIDMISHNEYFTKNSHVPQLDKRGEAITISANIKSSPTWVINTLQIISGDLNNDRQNDVILPVSVSDGNSDFMEYYLYLNTGTDFSYFSKYNSFIIADSVCNNKVFESSKFILSNINRGMIEGTSLYRSGKENAKDDYSFKCNFEHYCLNLESRKFELVYESELFKRKENTNSKESDFDDDYEYVKPYRKLDIKNGKYEY